MDVLEEVEEKDQMQTAPTDFSECMGGKGTKGVYARHSVHANGDGHDMVDMVSWNENR